MAPAQLLEAQGFYLGGCQQLKLIIPAQKEMSGVFLPKYLVDLREALKQTPPNGPCVTGIVCPPTLEVWQSGALHQAAGINSK